MANRQIARDNRRMNVTKPDGIPRLRIYRRKARGKHSARLLVKCGDCDAALPLYYDAQGLEIGGVHGSVAEWRRLLLPLLQQQQSNSSASRTPTGRT